jgi:hypothetical protein
LDRFESCPGNRLVLIAGSTGNTDGADNTFLVSKGDRAASGNETLTGHPSRDRSEYGWIMLRYFSKYR